MYSVCITEKATEKQRQFQNALLEALRHQPYQDISVTGLCAAAGLSTTRPGGISSVPEYEEVLAAMG